MQKRCWPVLLVLWPYVGIVLAEVQRRFFSWSAVPWMVWLAGMVIVCGVNIIRALGRKERAALTGMAVKLVLIPFYGITFFFGMVIFISAPPLVIGVLLLNMLLLAATSACTLRSTYLLWRAGKLSTVWALALGASQCIFVLDVAGSILLFGFEKRRSH